jgi:DNA-binding NarL/FixJ family response regulator
MTPASVIIIEDNPTLLEGYTEIVDSLPDFRVAGGWASCEEALPYVKKLNPQLVLMDIELPGMNGIQGTKEIKKACPRAQVIMVTVFEDSHYVFEALCAGATGYLTKNATPRRLERALTEALAGGAPMSMRIAKLVVQSFQLAPDSILTDKETEVLTGLAGGGSYKGIAQTMGISPNTVKFHVKNIYEKLQVHSREDAIEKARDQRLI